VSQISQRPCLAWRLRSEWTRCKTIAYMYCIYTQRRIMMAEVNGHRNRRRQKKWWGDMIQQDILSLSD